MSYNIEVVPARLKPFDWSEIGGAGMGTANILQNNSIYGYSNDPTGQTLTYGEQAMAQSMAGAAGMSIGYSIQQSTQHLMNGIMPVGPTIFNSGDPLYPLTLTNGLVFPYNPVIAESVGIKYDTVELVHSNESVHAYKNTDNVRISLSDCVWTSETFDQATYTLGVIHFLRSYSLMDFGRTGRPPSPMWFYAYGDFMYHQIPVLMERVEFSFPSDVDYVGVPNPGTSNFINQTLQYATSTTTLSQTGAYTWIPIKFTVSTISLVVQHSVAYWTKEFTLQDFKAGNMVRR